MILYYWKSLRSFFAWILNYSLNYSKKLLLELLLKTQKNITLKEDTNIFYCMGVLFWILFFSKNVNVEEKTPLKLNPFQSNVQFRYPLKSSKNICFFLTFSMVIEV